MFCAALRGDWGHRVRGTIHVCCIDLKLQLRLGQPALQPHRLALQCRNQRQCCSLEGSGNTQGRKQRLAHRRRRAPPLGLLRIGVRLPQNTHTRAPSGQGTLPFHCLRSLSHCLSLAFPPPFLP